MTHTTSSLVAANLDFPNSSLEQEEATFKAYCDQEEIGWNHFLLGNISLKWKEAMEAYWLQCPKTNFLHIYQQKFGPRNDYAIFVFVITGKVVAGIN